MTTDTRSDSATGDQKAPMRHTPGPWRIGPKHYKDGSVAIHADKHGSVFHLTPFSSTMRSAEANARLCAAAPDLLAALREAADEVVEAGSRSPKLDSSWLEKASAAIAKATGAA